MTKATANLDLQSFIANILAPIPEGDEQADTPKFRSQIARDINRAWEEGKRRLRDAKVLLEAERVKDFHSPAERACLAQLHAETLRQCLLLAPTEKELRWKKRETDWRGQLLPEAVKRAIALDEKRFSGGAA
jgi:hypothetical protein